MKRLQRNILIVFCLMSALFLVCSVYYYQQYREACRVKQVLILRQKAWNRLESDIQDSLRRFNGKEGVFIKDLEYNWVISVNADHNFASASLVKVPIMAACFQAIQQGKVNPEEKITLEGRFKTNGSGALKQMPNGSSYNFWQLMEYMITQSDNTASNIIIDKLGMDYLDSYFKSIGLSGTNISRKMMDFSKRRRGIENYTTAYDMARILELMYRRRLINEAVSRQSLQLLARQKINDRIPARLPSDVKVAHKTGLERNVCHDVGIVFTPYGDFLISVLVKHSGPAKEAKRLIAEVALKAYNYYANLQ
ncbi:MAG: class A beta-lactamase-related serine hydrolase [Candidatus Omnitrophica bacterium]|jgi:beta-lactamase class A|nr:class A beta-lactamase-related serine hydrolase [Candidatus Omnitrophota bacterium]